MADRPNFTGHVADAQTGLDYMQQRYYDTMLGRFLSVDPVTATSMGGISIGIGTGMTILISLRIRMDVAFESFLGLKVRQRLFEITRSIGRTLFVGMTEECC